MPRARKPAARKRPVARSRASLDKDRTTAFYVRNRAGEYLVREREKDRPVEWSDRKGLVFQTRAAAEAAIKRMFPITRVLGRACVVEE